MFLTNWIPFYFWITTIPGKIHENDSVKWPKKWTYWWNYFQHFVFQTNIEEDIKVIKLITLLEVVKMHWKGFSLKYFIMNYLNKIKKIKCIVSLNIQTFPKFLKAPDLTDVQDTKY